MAYLLRLTPAHNDGTLEAFRPVLVGKAAKQPVAAER
jgi:hypothetical protein